MNTIAMVIGYTLMVFWGVFVALVGLNVAGRYVRLYRANKRLARWQEVRRRALIEGLVEDITDPEARYWTSDRQIAWALDGPTPEEFWGEERAA